MCKKRGCGCSKNDRNKVMADSRNKHGQCSHCDNNRRRDSRMDNNRHHRCCNCMIEIVESRRLGNNVSGWGHMCNRCGFSG
jgi:hypothetical protein